MQDGRELFTEELVRSERVVDGMEWNGWEREEEGREN